MSPVRLREWIRTRTAASTIVLTVIGYGLVLGTFLLDVPIYPDLTQGQTNFLTHAIAVINATTTALLIAGWYWIRNGRVNAHRRAMAGAFGTILLFLVVYLLKVGGGGTKYFEGPDPAYYAYLLMLAVHIVLSMVAVPVVLYALLLGLTRTPAELRDSIHARVGRIAAGSWILSLVLGIVTYLMLNHIWGYTF
ncbi:putative membrane protein [Halovivax ruber XH-70]|uniref:Putative membrane protein n=1 Tax=Halovivax ruber (strain DSM 18193 / JCM 13892 / XH-70) TaxID=797302 RepID=L0IAU9_HALRX|nr:DUF420 domain-containing protein [Halovivax ruber]AGB15869.1 putative membrane protein [Halovivax ruber XH-70]